MKRSASAAPAVPEPALAARRAVTRFVFRFLGGWAVVLGLVAWVPGFEGVAIPATIGSLGAVTRACGGTFKANGSSLLVTGVGMNIVPDCTPLMPIAALLIAVLAFPAPWRWRLAGAVVGAAALWVYNLIRIFALVPVLRHHPEWFEFIHVYLWQTVTLLVVFGLFMAWLGLQRSRGPRAAAPAAGPDGGAPGASPA